MTIYVDPAVWPFRRQLYCHMMTDGDLSELHKFATQIGMKRSWFQPDPRHPHYDLSPSYRAKAVKAGAIEIEAIEMIRKCVRKQT